MAIIDCKVIESSVTITGGGTSNVGTLSAVFTDNTTKTVLKGEVTGLTVNETATVNLIDTTVPSAPIVVATITADTDGTYGFAFTPVEAHTYEIEIIRNLP